MSGVGSGGSSWRQLFDRSVSETAEMRQAAKAARDRCAEAEQARRDTIVRLKRIFKEAGLDFKE